MLSLAKIGKLNIRHKTIGIEKRLSYIRNRHTHEHENKKVINKIKLILNSMCEPLNLIIFK
uniref:Uncharacterized protein n=1 Tax=Rhizophora mucronata TaxID=61149 RepID=A0A2P2MMQ6_RHIMU